MSGTKAIATAPIAVVDPICGMLVDPDHAPASMRWRGQTHLFCSERCRDRFAAEPTKYLGGAISNIESEADLYTCPMHPQIRQKGPGHCPICGMTLEPVLGGEGPGSELADMSRRFWIALALTVPVMALAMGGHLWHLPLRERVSNWVQLVLATPVVFWTGAPFLVRGWESLRQRNLNMFTLIAMGTGSAWAYSAVATLSPALFPPAFQMNATVAVYFEAAAVITVLVLLGQVLELRARATTSGAIRSLLDLAPKTARRLSDDGSEADVAVDVVIVGDRLRVRPRGENPRRRYTVRRTRVSR